MKIKKIPCCRYGWQVTDKFDWQKHDRKNKKMLRENKGMANMV